MSHVAIYVQKHLTASNENTQRLTLALHGTAVVSACMYLFVLWFSLVLFYRCGLLLLVIC